MAITAPSHWGAVCFHEDISTQIRFWKEWDSCYHDLLMMAILKMKAAHRSRRSESPGTPVRKHANSAETLSSGFQ